MAEEEAAARRRDDAAPRPPARARPPVASRPPLCSAALLVRGRSSPGREGGRGGGAPSWSEPGARGSEPRRPRVSGGRGRGLGKRPPAPPETARGGVGVGRQGRGGVGAARTRGPPRGGLSGGEESFPGKARPSCRVRISPSSRGTRAAGQASCGVGPVLTHSSVPVLGRGAASLCPRRRARHGWPSRRLAPLGCPLGPECRALLAALLSLLLPGASWAALGAAARLSPGCLPAVLLAGFRARESEWEKGSVAGPHKRPWPGPPVLVLPLPRGSLDPRPQPSLYP